MDYFITFTCSFPQVPRDYDAFEKLQKDLLEQFPELKLPSLPRKYHLFMTEADVDERQISFDCLLVLVSRNPELATSFPVLEFLGVDLIADRKYHKKRQEYLKLKETEREKEKKREKLILGDNEEQVDLFGEEDVGKERRTDSEVPEVSSEDLFGDGGGVSEVGRVKGLRPQQGPGGCVLVYPVI